MQGSVEMQEGAGPAPCECQILDFGMRRSFENNPHKSGSFNQCYVLACCGMTNGNISFLSQLDHRTVQNIIDKAQAVYRLDLGKPSSLKCKAAANELNWKNTGAYSAMLSLYALWHRGDPRRMFDVNAFLLAFCSVAAIIESGKCVKAPPAPHEDPAKIRGRPAGSLIFKDMKFNAMDVNINVFYMFAMGLREQDGVLDENGTDACRGAWNPRLRCFTVSTYRSDPRRRRAGTDTRIYSIGELEDMVLGKDGGTANDEAPDQAGLVSAS